MQGDGSRRSAGGAEIDSRGWPAVVVKTIAGLALCLSAAGCASIGQALGPSASARDVSIAFESIDGLPRDVSQRLLQDLDQEATALRIAVIPAGGEAPYRIRAYLAAHAQGSGTVIAWAWDVYDAELQRAFRLSGEERTGASAGRSWAAADEALLRRIARSGMEQLAGFMASAPAPAAPAAPAPVQNGSAVAGRDDLRGGTAGSFHDQTAALEPVTVPLPQRRPVLAGTTGTTRLADATFGR